MTQYHIYRVSLSYSLFEMRGWGYTLTSGEQGERLALSPSHKMLFIFVTLATCFCMLLRSPAAV